MGGVFRQGYGKKGQGRRWSKKWYGNYKDVSGRTCRVALSTDKRAAEAMLSAIKTRVELERAGLRNRFTDAANEELPVLLERYIGDMKLRNRSLRYRRETELLLRNKILPGCGFKIVADIVAEPLDTYLDEMSDFTTRTQVKHRVLMIGFARWLVKKGKLQANPLEQTTKPEGPAGKKRRAFSFDELRGLVAAALVRPLEEAKVLRTGPRRGEAVANLSDRYRKILEMRGRNNSLLYRTAFYTGLRANELRALRGANFIAGPNPELRLPGERTKNKKPAVCPIMLELASDLERWMTDKGIGPKGKLFAVPQFTAAMIRRDLEFAGIPIEDAEGKAADFHSLRVSLSTHLGESNVKPTVHKKVMRHSTIEMSLVTYHDDSVDDPRAAIGVLPMI